MYYCMIGWFFVNLQGILHGTFGIPACSLVGETKIKIKDAILDGIIPNEYEPAREYMMKVAEELGVMQK